MKKLIFASLTLVLVMASVPAKVFAANHNSVGMWYATTYANEGNYLWAKGQAVDSTERLIGDVNGDYKDDVVFFYNSGGVWHTLLSNGNGFTYGGQTNGHGQGASRWFLGYFNNDHCADAYVWWAQTGDWRVWLSDCNGHFIPDNTIRIGGHGVGSMDQLVGDINGDGKTDAVIITPNGDWHGAVSNGSTFTYSGRWKVGHGAGSQFKHFVKNVNNDSLDDAIAYDTNTSNWYVSTNNGVIGGSQTSHGLWRQTYGVGSQFQLLGHADNNLSEDILIYHNQVGGDLGLWYIAESQDTKFNDDPRTSKEPRITNHGYSAKLQAASKGSASWAGVGDLNGDGIEELVVFHNRGTNGQALGEWRVLTLRENDADYPNPGYWNAKYGNPDQLNYWQSNLIEFKPVVNGVPQQYDSGDTSVIDSHLAKMDEANIDYLLFDLTNGAGWVEDKGLAVCQRMAVYNNTHGTNLKFAVAQGSGQYYYVKDPDKGISHIENDAGTMLNKFVNDPTCGPLYFKWQGKPLLVNMFTNVDQVKTWEQTPNKANTPNFTVRYTLGSVPYNSNAEPYPSKFGQGCGTIPTNVQPWPAEWGFYTGWGMPWGSLPNSDIMVTMPGWYVHHSSDDADNKRVSRTQYGVEGRFYSECGWDRVLANNPQMAVINSFNEFAEETGVEPSNTSDLTGLSEHWSNTDMYWNTTKNYIAQYKSLP